MMVEKMDIGNGVISFNGQQDTNLTLLVHGGSGLRDSDLERHRNVAQMINKDTNIIKLGRERK